MPYAATATIEHHQINGEGYVYLTISETGVTGATDEKEIVGLPEIGEITYVSSALTAGAGTATTIQPQSGEVAGSSAVWSAAAAGATVREAALAKRFVGGTLFWQSNANGTADAVTSTVIIKFGHHP